MQAYFLHDMTGFLRPFDKGIGQLIGIAPPAGLEEMTRTFFPLMDLAPFNSGRDTDRWQWPAS